MTMMERYVPLPGYEDFYEISNLGKIKSLDLRDEGRIMKFELDRSGYLVIKLTRFGIRKKHAIHKLVYTTFNGDLLPGDIVHHKDEDKLNNANTNLLTVNATEYRRMHSKSLKPIYVTI